MSRPPMRQRRAAAGQADDEGLLDEGEQQAEVDELKQQAGQQTRTWSRVWLGAVLTYTTALSLLAAHQLLHPWELRHHAHFHGSLSAGGLAILEALSGLQLLPAAAALYILPRQPVISPERTVVAGPTLLQQLLFGSQASCLMLGLVWALLLFNAHSEQASTFYASLRHAWLPLLPLTLVFICREMVRWQQTTADTLRTLVKSMYSHKKA